MRNGFLAVTIFLFLTGVSAGEVASVKQQPAKASPKSSLPRGVQEEWVACKADSDCTAALRGCWSWVPVNKEHLKDFMENSNYFCPDDTKNPDSQPIAACVQNTCQAMKKTTSLTMPQWYQQHHAEILDISTRQIQKIEEARKKAQKK